MTSRGQDGAMDVVVGPPSAAEVVGVWALARDVLAADADEAVWREQVWARHAAREGFRLVRAVERGSVVGFAYGYTGRPGQWWTDEVAQVLEPAVVEDWVGGHFEVVSLAVDVPHQRWLLMTTSDRGDPARRLYRSLGWGVLGPGVHEGTVVLGLSRPG